MLRRGSGQGDLVCRRVEGWWERAVQLEQKEVGGPCEGKRWGHMCPNQGLLCPREQAGQVPVKVSTPNISVHFSAAQSLLRGRGFPGLLPSQR